MQIQNDLPMWVNFKTQFYARRPDASTSIRSISTTDGAETVASGDVDFAHWPEQLYHVKSVVHFQRMREIFWKDEKWALTGDGDFNGTFRLYKGGHDLSGTFASPRPASTAIRFPKLYGCAPLDAAGIRGVGRGRRFFTAARRSSAIRSSRLVSPRGRRALRRLGVGRRPRVVHRRGEARRRPLWRRRDRSRPASNGRLDVLSSARERQSFGGAAAGRHAGAAPSLEARTARDSRREWGPFAPLAAARAPADRRRAARSSSIPKKSNSPAAASTPSQTHVTFQGQTAWGSQGRIAFHVVSRDWQESDEVMAGILTAFGARTGPVAFGGRGEFDGVMTGPFRRPRVEGDFTRHRPLGLGHALGGRHGPHRRRKPVRGREEQRDAPRGLGDSCRRPLLARLPARRRRPGDRRAVPRVAARPDRPSARVPDRRIPGDGLLSGRVPPDGRYQRPMGFGGITIDNGVAYGESLDKMEASLRFDGTGIRLDGINIDKGGGSITGAAFVGWDSTYSFNADGRRHSRGSSPLLEVSTRTAVGPRRVHGPGQRHVRYAPERLQDPRERSVRRRGRRRAGERIARRCAARS